MLLRIFIVLFVYIFLPELSFGEVLPPIGQRVYIINSQGELEISPLDKKPPTEKNAENVKMFKDPIFDKKKYMELQAQERKALEARSNLVNPQSLITLPSESIRGRAAEPRIKFAQKLRKVENSEEIVPFHPLEKLIPENQDLPDLPNW